MAIEDPREFTDHLHMIHPLLYDANGMPADEETSYAWACVKYARDVTPKHPLKSYVQRAQIAFRDRWLVAPRRRAQDPASSPFWPRDQYFAQGYQADLPWLSDREFQRQSDRTIYVSQEFIKEAKAEMHAQVCSLYQNELAGLGHINQDSNMTLSNQSGIQGHLYPHDHDDTPHYQGNLRLRNHNQQSVYHQDTHTLPSLTNDMTGYELPPLQIRDKSGVSSTPSNLHRQYRLPSVQYILHYRC